MTFRTFDRVAIDIIVDDDGCALGANAITTVAVDDEGVMLVHTSIPTTTTITVPTMMKKEGGSIIVRAELLLVVGNVKI